MCEQLTLEKCPSDYRGREPCDAAAPSRRAATDQEQRLRDNIAAIYHLIYASVGNREEAEDLTSRVFVKASQYLARGTNEDTYDVLVRLARVVIDDYWRTFSGAHTTDSDTPLVGDRDATQAAGTPPLTAAQRVGRILRLLPAREREVLTYRFILNRSVRETAEVLLLTEAEVMALVYHALKMAADLDPGGWRVP